MSAEIIELLKNDDEYYGGVGRQYLSNSDVGSLLTNPKEFGVQRSDSSVFAVGRLFHQLFLEPEKAAAVKHVDASTRATKIYKDFLAEQTKEIVLLTKEVYMVKKWVDAMSMNLDFFDIINEDGVTYEQPAIGEIGGQMWKCKADIITNTHLYDLKTTGDIEKFRYNFFKYNYDSQAYIYSTLLGKPMVFLVIDKKTLMMGKYTVSASTLEGGAAKVSRAIDVYQKFFGDNPTTDIGQFYFDQEI